MKEGRRDFLKTGLLASAMAFVRLPEAFPMSESADFWPMLRKQFPLDANLTYLNNGTMGPSPYPVLEAFKKAIDDTNTTGNYGGGKEEALSALARFTGSEKAELAITHNVTEGINIVCWGLKLKAGDEVIITDQEHVGNGLPWLLRSKLHKLRLKVISPAHTAAETLARIEKAITKKTKVIAVPHVLCTTGQVLPAKAICALAKSKGIFSFIDGAHGPGMLQPDLHDMGCDAYASCCHKWMLAPKGTGFLYVKKEKLDDVQAYHVGGYSSGAWDLLSDPPQLEGLVPTAHRYFYGTQSAALYYGIEAAVLFQEKIGTDRIRERALGLGSELRMKLADLGEQKLTLLTPEEPESRGAVIAFRPKNKGYSEVVEYARKQRIILRAVPENGVNCVRVSTHIYNQPEEIDALISLLKDYL